MRAPGFEPGAKPWQGFVLPNYTTPAYLKYFGTYLNFIFLLSPSKKSIYFLITSFY